jgi:hypothetical protein
MFIRFISLEELMRWVLEPVNDFHREHLWFPKYQPLVTEASQCAFMKNLMK